MQNLYDFIRIIESWGMMDVMLPFLLIFTIFYAIFQKAKVLSEKKGINVSISAVIALIPIVIHVTGQLPAAYDPVNIINQAIPGISMVVVALISLLIIIGIFGGTPNMNFGAISIWTAGIIGLFVVNTVWYNNKDFSFLISMIVITIGIFLFFKTGFPGIYDLVMGSATCFILYMFGRTAGWFSQEPFWIRDSRYVSVGLIVFIMMTIIGYATRPDGKD